MTHNPPVIIPRSEHGISRSLVSPNALKVLYRLRDSGFTAHLVGGCVRDLLLGREPKDFDVATDATPGQLKRIFRNCRLVGRRFRLAHLHFRDEVIEVATFRALHTGEAPEEEGAGVLMSEEGMILRDNVFGSPLEDALRRDFTVNAMSYDISDFSIIDYAGGLADLQAGVIRTIGNPAVRFVEDPVRMLRAIRFSALLGFRMEEETWQAVLEQAPAVVRAAPPRLYEEVLKLLSCGEGEACYQLLKRTGVLHHLLPDFAGWLETESGGFPHQRVARGLEHADLLAAGKGIAPPLLLALVFGEYLEERSERFRREGLPPQQAYGAAVASFLEETVPTVLIPARVAVAVREILYARSRFRKIPGKRPAAFIARPGFADALEYQRFLAACGEEPAATVAWWERFCAGEQAAAPPLEQAAGEGEQKKRKRRRRRRKPSAAAEGKTAAKGEQE